MTIFRSDVDDLKIEDNDLVLVTRDHYEELLQDQEILQTLQAFGVDNWEGYDEAMRSLYAEEDYLERVEEDE